MKKLLNFKDIDKIKTIILNDGIIVFPTETVYGIGGSVYSENAINKIFDAKGRPNDTPLIVHISDIKMLDGIVKKIDNVSKKLMENFWPGPLTIILPKKENISNLITAGLDTVGVRMPENEIALRIISASGVPLAAPSANVSGRPSGTNILDIYNELEDKIDAIIDGGNTNIGIESTVVRVVDDVVHILRPGKITKEDIINIGLEVVDNMINEKIDINKKVISPGMKYKHYAPNTKAILVYSEDNEKMIAKINELSNENTVVIVTTKNADKYNSKTLIMGNNLEEISKNIFSTLRKADKLKADLIIIEGVKSEKLGTAIMNRLIKACSYNYIDLDK